MPGVARGAQTTAEGLADVNNDIEYQVTSSVWDGPGHSVTLEHRFLNTSRSTLKSPIRVQYLDIDSDVGQATLRDGTRMIRRGQVVDISDAIPERGLAPRPARQ